MCVISTIIIQRVINLAAVNREMASQKVKIHHQLLTSSTLLSVPRHIRAIAYSYKITGIDYAMCKKFI